MRTLTVALIIAALHCAGCATGAGSAALRTAKSSVAGERIDLQGFFNLRYDDKTGHLLLAVERFDEPFLYQSSLARGVGSNDLGLDRGQLGHTRVVSFVRSGNKVLLIEDNLGYRATSDNPYEQLAIAESFARSVVWGFEIHERDGDRVWLDASDFFLRDAHGLAASLKRQKQGQYTVDASRSAIYRPRTRAFPDNTEVEAIVTFTGEDSGEILRTVVPDSSAITVHMHHSFVRLPDAGYEPLPYDPRSGFLDPAWTGTHFDYGTAVGEPTERAFAWRHRLAKKYPDQARSVPVEPIVYYLDRGVPEPVRGALIDGAAWWNEAFEAAGYDNAFQVKLLPEGADPMDVRYNVIQWVHRSTRGWSYGASVVDPRSGEIIKGHVTLGSLRVRQDYLIAEGLLSPYVDESEPPQMLDMALARIRQLSAHEVGHTLGLEHNFAGSVVGRSSVMDYPFPLIQLDNAGGIDVSNAYGVGIGSWDTRAILWGYGDFSGSADPQRARAAVLRDTYAAGHLYVSDVHARAVGTQHPDGNLWDNGADAIAELEKLRRVRQVALARMSAATIRHGRPLATIEEALVPIYLLHRYQIQAVGKLLGGARFNYALRGDGQLPMTVVPDARQRAALAALLDTLSVDELQLPPALLATLPPRPPGFAATRELFARQTGDGFDALAPARAYADLCMAVLLDPQRAARLTQAAAFDSERLGFAGVLDALLRASWYAPRKAGRDGAYQRVVNDAVVRALIALAQHQDAAAEVRARSWASLQRLADDLAGATLRAATPAWRDNDLFTLAQLRAVLDEPTAIKPVTAPPAPPGSPIG